MDNLEKLVQDHELGADPKSRDQLTNEHLCESKAIEKFITKVKNQRDEMIAIGITITHEDLACKCI